MGKGQDKQDIKAEIREAIVQWMSSRYLYSSGCFYDVVDKDTKIVRWVDDKELFYTVLSKSREVCAVPHLGYSFHFWDKDVKQVIEHCTAIFYGRKDAIVAVGDTPLSGDYSDRPYAINRLPIDFGLPYTMQPEEWPAALDTLMETLPEFYHDLKGRMVSPEMWDILTCFFGRVVSEDTPSEEFVYWWGEGGDGKGSLTDLFFEAMPDTSTPISHDNFESRFGAGVYGDKRLVRIDEVPPGGFFTERVKEVTGGAKFISVERKGKDAVKTKSRLAVMFASNFSPSFDGSMAQKRRLRVIECSVRTSPARDVKNELAASFDVFLGYCLINYARHQKQIPENAGWYLARLSEDTNMRADTWITSHIEYDPGGWMSSAEILATFQETQRFGSKLSFEKMMRRFQVVMQQQSTDGGVVVSRQKDRTRGWQNVKKRWRGMVVLS